MLQIINVPHEEAVDAGIRFVRRSYPDGYHYFFVNSSSKPISQWISLGRPAKSAVLMNPMFDNFNGTAAIRTQNGSIEVFLQLQPNESIILRTFIERQIDGPMWQYVEPKGNAVSLEGKWDMKFIDGGPGLLKDCQMEKLISWTDLDDLKAKSFAGTARYKIEFDKPEQRADDWILDLGKVCESAGLV